MRVDDESQHIKDTKLRIIYLELQRATQMMRPCNIKPVKIIKNGDGWLCILGDGFPVELVRGYGKTPEEACLNFDKAWCGEAD
ncbi:hypothetical protein [Methanoregula sp.]|uniref:hypothetical protein n=1 Tax=Methanoregula sp. TaxID=2052170 RepID=UPI0025CCE33B|nr:hypothetical protein [Methanoregula sp.]